MNLLSLAGYVEPQLCMSYIQGLQPQIRACVIQARPKNVHDAEFPLLYIIYPG